ncbi:hypothetical protein HY485_02940, partial [Candidatus Woesearchaeota archaeon]|nr:hypothetical protein [Candidatus Woesearchaeota archaeon]
MMHKNIRQIFSVFFVLVFIISLLIIPFSAAQTVEGSSVESVVESVDNTVNTVENEVEFNLNVVPVVFSQLVVPCSPVYFEVSVENTGSFEDDVVFSLSPLVGVEITPSEVVFKPGEKQKVMISFVPDECSVFGEFPLVFTAQSRITGLVVELDLSLVIDAADVATVGNGVDRIVAGKSLLSAQIPVKNDGSADAVYKASVDGPSWVKLDKNEIVVPAGTERSLLLIINPDESVQYDDYSVTVNVASTISNRIYSKSLVVHLAGPTVFSGVISSVVPKFVPFVKTGLSVGVAVIVLFIIITIIRKRSNRKEDEDFSEDDDVVEEDSDSEKENDEIKHTVVDERKLRRDVARELRNNFVLIPKSSVLSPQFLWVKWLVRLFAVAIIVALGILGYSNKGFVLDYLDYFSVGVIFVV